MTRFAFRMKLYPGREAEYERRHAELWPELAVALRDAGVSDYTIWLDRETGVLFALMHLSENPSLEQLVQQPIMRQWWQYMAELMETNDDHSPVVKQLEQVFHLD